MTDNEKLHQDFLRDFSELLRRYDADFEVIDFERKTPFAQIYFHGSFNEDGDPIRPYSDFKLPSYINGT